MHIACRPEQRYSSENGAGMASRKEDSHVVQYTADGAEHHILVLDTNFTPNHYSTYPNKGPSLRFKDTKETTDE